ncbi:hypothetical protein [Apilactobacillus quenuiae]|uniref:hypothetical protein n=1 Tax=Apilactobacillus quenuiae TaxID=2008377 RepID=UPI0013000923|nr:hypothetical protein [Apilactobacillus quenuiae]
MNNNNLDIIEVENMVNKWLNEHRSEYTVKNVQQTQPWVPGDEIVLSIRCKKRPK